MELRNESVILVFVSFGKLQDLARCFYSGLFYFKNSVVLLLAGNVCVTIFDISKTVKHEK